MKPVYAVFVLCLIIPAPVLAQGASITGSTEESAPTASADSLRAQLSTPFLAEPTPNVAAAKVDNRTLVGAGVGFVVGAGATWAALNAGGSTAPCDRDANQDAMGAGECLGLAIVGGALGALVGALVTRWL